VKASFNLHYGINSGYLPSGIGTFSPQRHPSTPFDLNHLFLFQGYQTPSNIPQSP
jgi:hypothetical protein